MDLTIMTHCNFDPWHFFFIRLILFIGVIILLCGLARFGGFLISKTPICALSIKRRLHGFLLSMILLLNIGAALYWRYFLTIEKPAQLRWAAANQSQETYVHLFLELTSLRFQCWYWACFSVLLLACSAWLLTAGERESPSPSVAH